MLCSRISEYIIDLEELHAELCEQMAKAQTCYQGPADRRREPAPDFQVGQQVYVSTEHIRTTRPLKKLFEKYLGPFNIIQYFTLPHHSLRIPGPFLKSWWIPSPFLPFLSHSQES